MPPPSRCLNQFCSENFSKRGATEILKALIPIPLIDCTPLPFHFLSLSERQLFPVNPAPILYINQVIQSEYVDVKKRTMTGQAVPYREARSPSAGRVYNGVGHVLFKFFRRGGAVIRIVNVTDVLDGIF